jgi:hypothetical protein
MLDQLTSGWVIGPSWPAIIGGTILLIMCRWKLANPLQRIARAVGGVLVFVWGTSARDPVTGAVVLGNTHDVLITAMCGLGLIVVVSHFPWED